MRSSRWTIAGPVGLAAVIDVGGAPAGQLGVGGDVTLDEVDAVVVVERDVNDGHAAVNAL